MRRPPLAKRLSDDDAEQIRQSTHGAITEMQGLAILDAIVIENVALPDSVPIFVSHRLGKAPRFVGHGLVRTGGAALVSSGTIVDFGSTSQAGAPIDRSKMIQIGNFNFGQALTVDLFLVP
jgi:hypothetical protein